MEVATGFERKDSSKCPRPCKECKPVCKGFKKLNVKDSELIEYLRNEKELERDKEEREGRKVNNEEIESKSTPRNEGEFAAHRQATETKRPSNNLQGSQPKLKCFHCDSILQQVSGLLDEVKTIKESEAHGLCQQCKLTCFSGKCKRCYYLINKYLSDKMTQHKIRHQKYKMWLSKLKEVLLSILQTETVCRHKENVLNTTSNHELENLLKELKGPLFSRDLEIGPFPTSEFKDTFDISESLTENKDMLEMVLKKLKDEGKILNKEKEVGANQTSSSSSLLTGSLPSLRTKYEMLQSKYAMYQKYMDSDFAFTSDRLELEFKTNVAKGLKQTATTQKVLQFGTSDQQKPTINKPKSKNAEVESIMKKSEKRDISLKTRTGDKKETSVMENKKSYSRDISDEDRLTVKDLEAAQIARVMKIKKQEKDKQKREKEPKQTDKSSKISDIKGSTARRLELIQNSDKVIHKYEIPIDLSTRKVEEKNLDSEEVVMKMPSGLEHGTTQKGSGSETELDGENLLDVALERLNLEKIPVLAIEEKKHTKKMNEKENSAKDKKQEEGFDEKDVRIEKKRDKVKIGKGGEGIDNQNTDKGKRKKKKKGRKEEDEEESSKEDEVRKIKKKRHSGVSEDIEDSEEDKENLKKLKTSESTKLLLKLLKQKEKEREKKHQIKAMEDKEREKDNKTTEKFKKKMEKATNKIIDTRKLDLGTHKHRRHLGHVRSDFLTSATLVEEVKEIECNEINEITEIIKGDQVIPFDSHYKTKSPDPEKPLFYKVHQNLADTSPPKSPAQSMTTVTPEKQQNKESNYSEPNIDINSKGIFRYALSKPEFIEKGYTNLPTIKVIRMMNVYKMVPANPRHNWFERHKLERILFYDTGEKLAETDEDGHGRWYYKNGIMALDYYKAKEIRTNDRYVVYSSGENDAFGNPRFITVLASFDQLGNGLVYDHNGFVRLKYNQSEGVIIDEKIGPPGRWKWHSLNDPPVLQPIYLDTHLNFKERRQSFQDQELVEESRETDDDKMLAVEFDNFIKHRADKLKLKFEPFQIRMKAFKINEQFSLHVVDQSKIFLMFRDGLVSMKLNLGMKLISSEIVDREVADVSDVHTPFDRVMPKSASVANIKSLIDDTKRKCRILNRKI